MKGIINFIVCGLCLGFALGMAMYQEPLSNWSWFFLIMGFVNLFMGVMREFDEK